MLFITMSKQNLLGLLLIACNAQAAMQTYTPENTVVFVQGYNVIYKNNMPRILAKCTIFLVKNPSLSTLLVNQTFLSRIRCTWNQKLGLSAYYDIFETFDTSNRIKSFAQRMLLEGKDSIAEGIKVIQALVDAGYQVVILTGQDETQNAEFKKTFPIMAHNSVQIVNSYAGSIEAYSSLKAAYDKEHAILIYGNKDHRSVAAADEAGLIIKHYSDAIIA